MGYAPPSYEDLPLPTRKQFEANPDYYWGKLHSYRKKQQREINIKILILGIGTILALVTPFLIFLY